MVIKLQSMRKGPSYTDGDLFNRLILGESLMQYLQEARTLECIGSSTSRLSKSEQTVASHLPDYVGPIG